MTKQGNTTTTTGAQRHEVRAGLSTGGADGGVVSAAARPRRRAPGMSSAERAKLLSRYSASIAAREAADPLTPYRKLHGAANPTPLGAHWNWPQPLSGLYTWQRRACLVRAWAALEIVKICGDATVALTWRCQAREDLARARRYGELTRIERAREYLAGQRRSALHALSRAAVDLLREAAEASRGVRGLYLSPDAVDADERARLARELLAAGLVYEHPLAVHRVVLTPLGIEALS